MFHSASVVQGAGHVQQAYDDASENDNDQTLVWRKRRLTRITSWPQIEPGCQIWNRTFM